MIAFVYSGQGQVMANMGEDFYQEFPEVRSLYDASDRSQALKEIAFQADEKRMLEKEVHQELVVQFALAVTRVLKGHGIEPAMTFGLSLGEFPALGAASTLAEEAIMRFVHYRSEAMEYACEVNPGSMVAVIGAAPQLEDFCEEVRANGEWLSLANDNSPKQKVLAGTEKACAQACEWCKENKIRAIPLKVNGAFHSEMMRPALDKLAPHFHLLTNFSLHCPVLHNSTARPLQLHTLKKALSDHLVSPVLFTQSIREAAAFGIQHYIVIGPGKAPEGFIKQTLGKETKVHVINSVQDMKALLEEMKDNG